jgi:hypothetical protein
MIDCGALGIVAALKHVGFLTKGRWPGRVGDFFAEIWHMSFGKLRIALVLESEQANESRYCRFQAR